VAKSNTSPMRVIEETPRYWRAIFDYPPFNVVDADVFQAPCRTFLSGWRLLRVCVWLFSKALFRTSTCRTSI
jgi:hypothetical protein